MLCSDRGGRLARGAQWRRFVCLAALAWISFSLYGAGSGDLTIAVARKPAARSTRPWREPRRVSERAADPIEQSALQQLCDEHARVVALRSGDALQVVTAAPFVVAGDFSRQELSTWLNGTILPFSRALAQRYFDRAPDKPVVVLLFSSEPAYREYAQRLFGDVRISRFGYYKPDRGTLLANVGEGPAPLLHELTHALMTHDFPAAPVWLSEGMAVMHESAEAAPDSGALRVRRLARWRMRVLRNAATTNELPRVKELMQRQSMSPGDEAVAYAQAGGWCLFLEQRQRLADLYRSLRDSTCERGGGRRCAGNGAADDAGLQSQFKSWIFEQAIHPGGIGAGAGSSS